MESDKLVMLFKQSAIPKQCPSTSIKPKPEILRQVQNELNAKNSTKLLDSLSSPKSNKQS